MATICVHAFVSGVVQGVWYRQSTKHQAQAVEVTGWARNLADGRVEVMLCGEEEAVRKVEQWLHEGPFGSRVESVKSETLDWQKLKGFRTG